MKLDPYRTPLTKINLKWIQDLEVRPEIIELEKKNTESTSNRSKSTQMFSFLNIKSIYLFIA